MYLQSIVIWISTSGFIKNNGFSQNFGKDGIRSESHVILVDNGMFCSPALGEDLYKWNVNFKSWSNRFSKAYELISPRESGNDEQVCNRQSVAYKKLFA